MRVRLDYALSPDWLSSWSGLNLLGASAMALRYEAFLGDVAFEVGSANFSARWGWVPVLDFAVSLAAVGRCLREERRTVFEFTESGGTILFENLAEVVHISCNYRPDRASVTIQELEHETRAFLERMRRDLVDRFPQVSNNAAFRLLTFSGHGC